MKQEKKQKSKRNNRLTTLQRLALNIIRSIYNPIVQNDKQLRCFMSECYQLFDAYVVGEDGTDVFNCCPPARQQAQYYICAGRAVHLAGH